MTRSFGESGLPVFHAGHALWQRPHSVQAYRSSICFHVRSVIVAAPRMLVRLELLEIDPERVKVPRGRVLAKYTLIALVAMCRCFEYPR